MRLARFVHLAQRVVGFVPSQLGQGFPHGLAQQLPARKQLLVARVDQLVHELRAGEDADGRGGLLHQALQADAVAVGGGSGSLLARLTDPQCVTQGMRRELARFRQA